MKSDYLEIILEDRIYTQRTPNSKLIKFNLDGIKEETYEELPLDVKMLVDVAHNMKLFPDDYFKYTEKDGKIEITDIENLDLSYIRIPEYIKGFPVTKLGPYAMKNLTYCVKQIQLPETLEEFSTGTFKSLLGLQHINIPSNIKKIPGECFYGCLSLKKVNLENIEEILAKAFENCDALKEVYLPKINYMDKKCFHYCGKLKKVEIKGELREISEQCFANCLELEDLRLPNSIKIIRFAAFQNCALPFFIAPENLLLIEGLSFDSNSMKVVHLNKNLKTVQESAFTGNDLIDIQMYSTTNYRLNSFSSKSIDFIDKQEIPER